MAPFRNPFGKKPPLPNGLNPTGVENQRPQSGGNASEPSSLLGSRTSSSISIKPKQEEPAEYKLSVYDSGVYLPPSPPEKKSFWARSPQMNGRSNHRDMLKENEPFSISRESFESYRRSFDISARSPVPQQDGFTPRQSLDSSKAMRSPRRPRKESVGQTDEEAFEDVGLNDEAKPAQPKKRGIFARLGDNSQSPEVSGDAARPSSSHRGFHLPGRKRGQSGQGAELGNIDRPTANGGDDGIVR